MSEISVQDSESSCCATHQVKLELLISTLKIFEITSHIDNLLTFFPLKTVFVWISLSHWQKSFSKAEPQGDKATHASGFSIKAEDLGLGGGQRCAFKNACLKSLRLFILDLEISHGWCFPINNTCCSRASSKAIPQFLPPPPVWRQGPKPLM